ncbi:MAG: DUF7064 domain-containing protein [Acidimicrobiia bacterium]
MAVAALDATFEERHTLHPARPHNRESLVWVLALPESELAAFAYTWVDGQGRAGAAGVAYGRRLDEPVFEFTDGIAVDDAMRFTDWKVGPIRTAHTAPLQTADITYTGEQLTMDFTFEALHEPYAYGTHAEGFPSFYADERYEQGGRGRGTLTVRGTEIPFDGFCHRDHSWGARDWGAVTHYKWVNFGTADASINVMDLQALGQRTVRGYVHRHGETAEILAARFDYDFDDAFYHRNVVARLDDDAGRTTVARTTAPATAQAQYPINPRLNLVDVTGPAEIDGVAGASYVEMAWTPGYLAERRARAGAGA